MLLPLLLLAFAGLTLANGADLAVVRPFASMAETREVRISFDIWNEYMPCGETSTDAVDLFLVYSRNLSENSEAAASVAEVEEGFRRRDQQWHRCFREVRVLEAHLSAEEDIYDVSGQATNPRWVSGPNAVFRFLLRHFLGSRYSAFFLMEMDSIPRRPLWLEQFAREAVDYSPAAIRGSRYRGDNWDSFLSQIPAALRIHINGNAIYNTSHPFLAWLSTQLHKEAGTDRNRIPYDLRMAELTMAAQLGLRTEYAKAWADLVPPGEQVYNTDSLLIGNYANTLLNTTFDGGEYVHHNSPRNIFSEVGESQVTLAVLHLSDSSFSAFSKSISTIHPFRKIVVLAHNQASHDGLTEVFGTPQGMTELTWRVGQQPRYMSLCEISSHVNTQLFAFTDSSQMIASPVSILMAGSKALLPRLDRSSPYCASDQGCKASMHQAKQLFGVELGSHYDKHSTLFTTSQVRAFCSAWSKATSRAWGHGHGASPLHSSRGPTADDYIAWQLSVQGTLDDTYRQVNKEVSSWRSWTIPNSVTLLHTRRLLADSNTSDISNISDATNTSNVSSCAMYLEQPTECDNDPRCMWHAFGASGRCIPFHVDPTPTPTPMRGSVAMQFHLTGLDYAQLSEETKRDLEDSIEVAVTNTTNEQLRSDGSEHQIARSDVTARVLPPDAAAVTGGNWLVANRRLRSGGANGVIANVSIMMPTREQSASVESAVVSAGSTLGGNIVAAVSAVENISAATIGTIAISGSILVTDFATPAPTPAPTPASLDCTWNNVGSGYCGGSGGLTAAVPLNSSLRVGSLADAQAACCNYIECGGFQYDTESGEYILLEYIEAPNGTDGELRRQCWSKGSDKSPESIDGDVSAAFSLVDGAPLLLAVLVVVVTSMM